MADVNLKCESSVGSLVTRDECMGENRFQLLRNKSGWRVYSVLSPCQKSPRSLIGRKTVCTDMKVNFLECQSGGTSRWCHLEVANAKAFLLHPRACQETEVLLEL